MPSDRYIDFANSDMGRRLVKAAGLPAPLTERWQAGRLRPVEGTLLISAGPLGDQVRQFASRLTDSLYSFGSDMPGATTWVSNQGPHLKAVVFDASQILRTDQLRQLRDFFQPLLRNLDHCAHVVILGKSPRHSLIRWRPALNRPSKVSAAHWPRKCATAPRSSCCRWMTTRRINWRVPCASSSRPRQRSSLASSST